MPDHTELSQSHRLVALWKHLWIERAHVATPIPGDLAELASRHAGYLAGIVLCARRRRDPPPFAAVGARVLMIGADRGPSAEATARAAAVLPQARRLTLAGY